MIFSLLKNFKLYAVLALGAVVVYFVLAFQSLKLQNDHLTTKLDVAEKTLEDVRKSLDSVRIGLENLRVDTVAINQDQADRSSEISDIKNHIDRKIEELEISTGKPVDDRQRVKIVTAEYNKQFDKTIERMSCYSGNKTKCVEQK